MTREYKDSGIEWIGQIPKEWKLATLKQIGTYINGYAFKPEDWTDSGKPIIRIQDLTGSMGSPNFYNGELDSKYLVSKGDILVSWAATLDAFIWEKEEGWLNQHIFKALPSSDVNYQFFYWLIKLAMENMNNDNKHGIVMQHVTTKVFGNFAVSIPSVNEQQRIADYLDKVCGEVDEMVALQETMIEELKAYKQSVITEAVTKGLNPNVPMRNSGIDWIGEIPEHWEVIKLSFLTSKIGSGSTPTGGANVYVHEGVKFLRSQNVYFEGLNLNDVAFITETIDEEMKGTRVKPGDVLLNITGGSIGRCYYVDESLGRANVNQHVSIIRPTKIETIYLKYSLQSDLGQNQIALLQTGGNREGLSAAALSNFKILFPPMSEQRTIASYLDTKCSEIDSLIALKQAKIEELKEYKKSVIYEYVTGKKEVV